MSNNPQPGSPIGTTLSEETTFFVLTRVGHVLGISIDPADIHPGDVLQQQSGSDPLSLLILSASHSGIFAKEIKLEDASEARDFVREGFPIIVAKSDGSFVVIESVTGRRTEASIISDRVTSGSMSLRELKKLFKQKQLIRVFVAKNELECKSISDTAAKPGQTQKHAHGHSDHGHGAHVSPLRRFLGLLNFDRRDVWTILLFALVVGILSLATPLAVESLINIVRWATYLQPLIVLSFLLLTFLGFSGFLRILQTVVVELIQRRQFVRIVSDLAHRFPRAQQAALQGEYPRELANRVFDIMTIQKSTASLLLDGVNIVLSTFMGLVLLAFYHPFLLGFDIALLIGMISITWVLGRSGIRTAVDESLAKYRVAHWLQDIIAAPQVFKTGGGESLAIQRTNQLTTDYINSRRSHFRVVLRQSAFAIGLQVIASTTLLALGGWLVIQAQLTLGQLVASELVVTVIVGAFAKAGKSIESFYDLMAGVDKVGHLLDISVDPRREVGDLPDGPVEVSWSELTFDEVAYTTRIPASSIAAGTRVAIVGDDVHGRSLLAQTLAGTISPTSGSAEVAGLDTEHAAQSYTRRMIGFASGCEIFNGSLRENVDLGQGGIGYSRVREVIQQVGLSDAVLRLPEGLQQNLQTGGYPLSQTQVAQVILARAMVRYPKLLVIDQLLDGLDPEVLEQIWTTLSARNASWTLVVVTNRSDIADFCDSRISVRKVQNQASERLSN